jgi:hypothetical protein
VDGAPSADLDEDVHVAAGICRRKKVAPHVKAMRAANGEQQVEFTTGR